MKSPTFDPPSPYETAGTCLDILIDGLGYTQGEIAYGVGAYVKGEGKKINPSGLSRIKNRLPWPISKRMAFALVKFVEEACQARFGILIPRLRMKVMETCNNQNVMVNDEMDLKLDEAVQTILINRMAENPAPVQLPEGVEAVLVSLGEGTGTSPRAYLLVVATQRETDGQDPETKQLRLLIHELEHMTMRLRAQLPPPPAASLPKSAF